MTEMDKIFMGRAIELAKRAMQTNCGGPFGAVIVKKGKIIAEGSNAVTSTNDPTAHAEIVAIRKACSILDSFQLEGCTIYTSCEPCPMCMGAIYWSRPDKVYFACTRDDAKEIGFDDQFIYEELSLEIDKRQFPLFPIMHMEALTVFNEWKEKPDRVKY